MARLAFFVLAALALAAGPLPLLSPEQEKMARAIAALRQRAEARYKAGEHAEALAEQEKALAVIEHLHGSISWRAYLARLRLGTMEAGRGGWAEAAAHGERAWRILSTLRGPDDWQAIDARREWEVTLAHARRTPAQRDAFRQALTRVGEARQNALRLSRDGKHAEAIAEMAAAVKMEEAVLGRSGSPRPGRFLNELAMLHDRAGDLGAALPLFRKALEVREGVLGRWHPDTAESASNLGMHLRDMGDFQGALPHMRHAVLAMGRARGRGHPTYATLLDNLAMLHQSRGEYRQALALCRDALALRRKHSHEAASLAMGLNNLASLHFDLSDLRAALPLFEQAHAHVHDSLGERHPYLAICLNNLGMLHQARGDLKAAQSHFERSLALHEALSGRGHPSCITALGNLARLHFARGDHGAGLPLLRRALSIQEKAGHTATPLHATLLHNLGSQHYALGEYKEALPLFRRSLALRQKLLGERHPLSATAQASLAMTHLVLGGEKEALRLAEAALAATSAHRSDIAALQSDRAQMEAALDLRRALDLRLSLPDAPGQPSAASHALAAKGSLLLSQLHRRLFLRLSGDPEARAAAADLESVTRRLAALRLSARATPGARAALEKEQGEAQARLSLLSADFRRQSTPHDADAIARALPEGAALIDYHVHGQYGLKGGDGRPRGEMRVTAFVHRCGRAAARIDLGRAADIGRGVRDWLPRLKRGLDDGKTGEALKRLVWTPLGKHLEGAKVVLVSPDGLLGQAPFAALPGAKLGTYLIEDVALAVVAVPSALPEMLRPVKKEDRLPPSLLVLGGLRYQPEEGDTRPPAGEDTRAAPRTGRETFAPLPGTRAEMLAVEASFRKLFKGGTARALTEGGASKPAVRKAIGAVRYAHFATHGWFAPETATSPFAGGGPAFAEGRAAAGWHPLLLSGLALSDAGHVPGPREEDGILTALEVSEMDLTRLELAVLSACETGLGVLAGGEGLLSMQRAFQAAGARSVIASLWKVDDDATRALMGDFYGLAWDPKRPLGAAEALRRAQLAMLNGKAEGGKVRGVGLKPEALKDMKAGTRVPPYYWAAFVLSGDWR